MRALIIFTNLFPVWVLLAGVLALFHPPLFTWFSGPYIVWGLAVIMLGMGVVFQMPAVTYVLARIGIVTAKFLVKIWKTALIVIMISAAILSPTADIPNMLLFAAPMIILYIVSIFVAWIFNKPRTVS